MGAHPTILIADLVMSIDNVIAVAVPPSAPEARLMLLFGCDVDPIIIWQHAA